MSQKRYVPYDLRHNTDRHFDVPLKTNRIKFLPSWLLCLYRIKKKPAFAFSIYFLILAPKNRAFYVYIKIDAISIIINSRRLSCAFVFSGNACVTLQVTSLTCKCSAVRFALYLLWHQWYLCRSNMSPSHTYMLHIVTFLRCWKFVHFYQSWRKIETFTRQHMATPGLSTWQNVDRPLLNSRNRLCLFNLNLSGPYKAHHDVLSFVGNGEDTQAIITQARRRSVPQIDGDERGVLAAGRSDGPVHEEASRVVRTQDRDRPGAV